MSENSVASFKTAPAPFNRPTADVILRTSDGVDFKVHKLILSEASPFFEAMFSLPQQPDDMDQKDGLPVIPIAQDRHVAENLLRFCYPVENPQITKLNVLLDLVAAASFYQMDWVGDGLRERILDPSFISQDPFRVYALACRSKWKQGAQAAARAMLATKYCRGDVPMPHHPAMEDITGGDIQRLLSYFFRCGQAARELAEPQKMTWIPYYPWFGKKPCSNCTNTEWGVYNCRNAVYHYVRTWWMDYMRAAGRVLEKSPCKDAILIARFISGPWNLEVLRCECSPTINADFEDFKKVFANAVEEAVSTVEMHLVDELVYIIDDEDTS